MRHGFRYAQAEHLGSEGLGGTGDVAPRTSITCRAISTPTPVTEARDRRTKVRRTCSLPARSQSRSMSSLRGPLNCWSSGSYPGSDTSCSLGTVERGLRRVLTWRAPRVMFRGSGPALGMSTAAGVVLSSAVRTRSWL